MSAGQWSRRSLASLAALVAALTLLHLAVNGYSFGGSNGRPSSPSSDHANILPWVYWYNDPSLFPHDAAIQMKASYATVLWRAAAGISSVLSVEATFFLLHVLSVAGAYAAILFLARAAGSSGAGGLLACLFFLIERAGPAGVGTHDPALYTRTAALPLGLWALGAILSGLPVLGGIVLGAVYAIHPLTAFYAAAIAFPLWLLSSEQPRTRRIAGAASFGGIALLASAVLGGDAAGRLGRPSDAWLQLQTGNNAMHLFPWTWGEGVWRDFLLGLLLLLPALLGEAHRSARRLAFAAALGAAALAGLGWATTAWVPSMLFMQIQPFRGLQLTIVVALVLGAAWIATQLGLDDFVPIAGASWPLPRDQAPSSAASLDARPADARSPATRSPGAHGKAAYAETRRPDARSGPRGASGKGKAVEDRRKAAAGGDDVRGGQLALAAGAIAVLGLVAHANLVAVAGIALLAISQSRQRLRLPLAGASAVLLLFWGSRDGASLPARMAPEALRSFGWIGGAVWGLALLGVPALLVLAGEKSRRHLLGAGALFLAAAAILLTTLGRDPHGRWRYVPEADYPLRDRTSPWVDVQRWVASHLPADAYVLNPPYLEGFRTYGRRSQFADWKQGTLSMFNEPFGMEWLRRMQEIVQRPIDPANAWRNVVLNYESMSPEALDALARRYGLTHMVTGSSAKDRPLPWREIYGNGAFRVLETGVPPPHARAAASSPPNAHAAAIR